MRAGMAQPIEIRMFSSLIPSVIAFGVAALVIVIAGSRLARQADILADRTGLGEALFGVLLLAGVTSLPDRRDPQRSDRRSTDLAMSNVMGSMAVNLVFLGVADVFYRKANLEHAAASPVNLMLAGLLIVLLTLPLLAGRYANRRPLARAPVTPVIVAAYLFGLHLVPARGPNPCGFPDIPTRRFADEPARHHRGRSSTVWFGFIGMAVVTGMAGWVLMEAAKGIADQSGLSESLVGGLFTALATSTPELVTTIAAIRLER